MILVYFMLMFGVGNFMTPIGAGVGGGSGPTPNFLTDASGNQLTDASGNALIE